MHGVQAVDEDLPGTDHDFRVRATATPTEVVGTGARRGTGRIEWLELDDDQLAAIPALGALRPTT